MYSDPELVGTRDVLRAWSALPASPGFRRPSGGTPLVAPHRLSSSRISTGNSFFTLQLGILVAEHIAIIFTQYDEKGNTWAQVVSGC